jgi:hypothetical protein
MLDDDDDSHMSRETNPRHIIALINLDNLYFVRHRRRMILNPKKERTKRKRSQYQSQTSTCFNYRRVVSSKPTYHPKNR